jgi:hypothetical protein
MRKKMKLKESLPKDEPLVKEKSETKPKVETKKPAAKKRRSSVASQSPSTKKKRRSSAAKSPPKKKRRSSVASKASAKAKATATSKKKESEDDEPPAEDPKVTPEPDPTGTRNLVIEQALIDDLDRRGSITEGRDPPYPKPINRNLTKIATSFVGGQAECWSWSVDGAAQIIESGKLNQFLDMYDPQIVCLNDTRLNSE